MRGSVTWRSSLWRDVDGQPTRSPSQRRRAEHTEAHARRAAEAQRAPDWQAARTRTGAAGPSAGYLAAKAALAAALLATTTPDATR